MKNSSKREQNKPITPQTIGEYTGLYEDYLRAPEKKEKKEKKSFYFKLAKFSGRIIKAKDEFKKEDYKIALDFLGWDLRPKEINAVPVFMMLLAMMICFPVFTYLLYSVFIIYTLPFMMFIYIGPPLIIVPFAASFYFQNYPMNAAKIEKIKATTYIPEIINYLVMSMKLTPNLEKAIDFAADHGRGKIAEDLKNLSWDLSTGVYRTAEEGLDKLAYKWAPYSEEFKHGLMMIRSSVIEIDEAKRNLLLDKAVTEVLEGIREKMDKYATEMRQPAIYLYYLGVLLPLMLIIMLPIGSVMAKLPMAQTWILVLMYNLLIPIGTVFFARNILQKRPPVYVPPAIPDDYPGLPKKGHIKIGKTLIPAIILSIISGILIFALFYFVIDPMLNPIPPAYFPEQREAYFPFFALAGAAMAVVISISIYLYGITYAKRNAQKELMKTEKEFQDSIYIIASRLGENRPLEEAIAYTAEFMKNTKVAEIFEKTNENISNLGMTAETALFDGAYGSLKNIPSEIIRSSMRIVVDSVALGVQQAARALISLSLQLRDSQKIRENIANMLGEITAMMKSIAYLIAPLVLGITSALQKIIISALKSVASTQSTASMTPISGITMPNLPMSSFGDPAMLAGIPDATTFLLIIAAYVIEITVVLIYFVSKIEEGDNPLALRINLAVSLPMAMAFFFIAAWFAQGFASTF